MNPEKNLKPPAEMCFHTLVLIAILLLSGCATPVGVNRLDIQTANRKLTENVLSGASLSAPTQQILNRSGLKDRYDKEPAAAIETLRAGMPTASSSDRFFALAELSFLHATRAEDPPHYLAAAVYAYAFLFPQDLRDLPDAFDPRLITAVNLYNQGIALGLAGKNSGTVELRADTYALPFGQLNISLDPEEFRWGPFNMIDFTSAAQLDVRGLRNDYRWPGIGAAMVASLQHIPGMREPFFLLVPSSIKMAVTAFLRLENIEKGIDSGQLQGEMVLYTTEENTVVEVNGRRIPLEFGPTTALATTLEGSQVYDLELKGLLAGDLNLFKQSSRFKDNVFLMSPYRPGKIPLVLVHGTASSPARWAELLNEILNDRELLQHYQVWLFTYNTGNPVLYSGGLLVQALKNMVKEFDPEGREEALQKMVVIGHSQGGLLAKLTAIDSETASGTTCSPFQPINSMFLLKRVNCSSAAFFQAPAVCQTCGVHFDAAPWQFSGNELGEQSVATDYYPPFHIAQPAPGSLSEEAGSSSDQRNEGFRSPEHRQHESRQ